jgi:predicted transcriptional regulator
MSDDFQQEGGPRDLLGDPYDQNRESWGRPKFKKTKEKQEAVIALSAAGWTQQRIARYLGCDVKTLRNHFSRELTEAADRAEGEAIVAIHKRMRDGNVTAANRVIAMAEKGRAAPPAPRTAQPEDAAPEPEKAQPKGKKEQLAEAAQTPTGRWGSILQ